MNATVRTTVVYGMISAIAVWPAAGLMAGLLGWATAFKLMLWFSLAGYAMLLARWSGKPRMAPLFVLALLLGAALWPGSGQFFFFILLGGLSWIRSGICFDRAPFRTVIAESFTIAGGAGLVAGLNPGSSVTWSLCIWLFILVQSLYFFIVPTVSPIREASRPEDPFERAYHNARRILEG